MRLIGRSVHSGIVVAPTRLITPHQLAELHYSGRQVESDQELKEIFRNSSFRSHTLSDLGGRHSETSEDRTLLEVTFWSAVNEVLESRGGGIVYSVASVISRYLRSAIFSLDPIAREEYRCLAELGKSVLSGLLRFRRSKYSTSSRYIVLAGSLSLQEAVTLEPRIVGYAVGTGVDAKLRIVAEILEVPAVAGLEGIERQAEVFSYARLDGDQGTLESVDETG